jgi:folylpolyglutamate synthase/dihydropteroate synthase
MKDKEYQKMLSILLPVMDRVVITRPAMERALPPQELKGIVKEGLFIDNMRDALKRQKRWQGQMTS